MKKEPKNIKNEDYLFIRGFTSIHLTDICKKLKISRGTIISAGYSDESKYKLVRKEIEKEIAKLYLK